MKRAAAPVLSLLTVVIACAGPARLPLEAGIGPRPQLPPPEHVISPNVNVAKAAAGRPVLFRWPLPASR